MKFSSTILSAFLLGIVVTAENYTDTKTPEQEVEKPNHEQQTTTTTHDVKAADAENQKHVEQPPPSTGSAPNNQTEVTSRSEEVELTGDEIEDVSHHVPGTNFSRHAPQSSVRGQIPRFRRYFDLFLNLAIEERYVDGRWERIDPPPQLGEDVTCSANSTRYVTLENGTRVQRRTKYDYSYDNVHWYRPSRTRTAVSHPELGTVYKYKFGPKKWLSPYRNRIFSPNQTIMTVENMGPGRTVYLFGKEESFFRPPLNYSGDGYKFNIYNNNTFRREVYNYGPVTESGTRKTVSAPVNNSKPRRFPTGNRYYGYGYHRNQFYNPRRWYGPPNDGRWNQPFYQGYPPAYPAYGPEPRYYDHGYNQQYDRNYGAEPAGYYQDRGNDYRHEGNYDRRGYGQSPEGVYDDRRYERHYDDPQVGRGYDQGHRDSHDQGRSDQKYGESYNQGYRDTHGQGRHDQKYGESYNQGYRDTHDQGRNDQKYGESYNQGYRDTHDQGRRDQKYGESYQDGKRHDQGYGNRYEDRNRDYQSNNQGRRSDGSTYRESAGSNNGSGYQQQRQPIYSNNFQNRRAGYQGEGRSYDQYRYEQRNREHGESYEEFKWKFPYLDRNTIPEDQKKQAKYFVREYYDLLAKTSKHLWILHRDIRTVLQDIEVMKQNSLSPKYIPVIVNGTMILLSNLASAITNRMDGNLTTDDIRIPPIDKVTFARMMTNFDKMMYLIEEYRKPGGTSALIEGLHTRLTNYKKYWFITYGDITHMLAVIRRTMKRYGFLEDMPNT